MKTVEDGRHAYLMLKYNGKEMGTEYLSKYLMDFTYEDSAPGDQDSISVTLDDREANWQDTWKPKFGDKLIAEITVVNWDKPGEKAKLPCGSFEVDSIDIDGPPDKVMIQALALPLGGAQAKQENRTKSWEKVKLKTIAQDIAGRAKLKLVYSAVANPTYERLDQSDQTDFSFLVDKAKDEGIAVKISGGSLVLFDEAEYEKKPAVIDIVKGKSNILNYSFSESSTTTAYGKCVVTYRPPASAKKAKKKEKDKSKDDKPATIKAATNTQSTTKVITGEYSLPNATGLPVLRINERVETVAEANRLAKNRLREQNKKSGLASFSLDGDIRFAAGITINAKGFGRFNGKYIVVSATHRLGTTPYETEIQIRKVLGW
ncbi:contractile injection system protein, VgrG/Pvc8 family [Paenibacillus sp. Marseille-Q4541]|uniref:phage late control D family protein n=1 Tax=Paenibacillus sp. Marseille-Q4541 TaxID=2831522 RepID=UPI001BAD1BC1|nr:contractile injection system protein, VgrG/Pvc8 family [Paenibacillus sp. Marseille-Q4541]